MSWLAVKPRLAEILRNASFGCVQTEQMDDDSGNALTINFFSQPDPARPFGLEVGEQIFWIPKDGLCAYSPVFKSMLYGQFAESNRETVKLPQKRAENVHELLLCLFPTPVVKKVDDSNVDLLLDFADEYEIADLTSRCSDFLYQKMNQLRNGDERLIEILVLASKHRLRQILFRIVERCAESFDLEKFEPFFEQLSSEVLGALAWYKCQRTAAGKCSAADFLQQHMVSMCNNCKNGHTQNRCTVCGGVQKCPLCNSVPRRSRPCSCSTLVAALTRAHASVAVMAETLDSDKSGDASDNGGGKSFDGASLLLKRL